MDDPNVSESVTTASSESSASLKESTTKPQTTAGRALFTDNEPMDMLESNGVTWDDVIAIEAEARVGAVSEQASDWMRRAAEKIAADPSGLRAAAADVARYPWGAHLAGTLNEREAIGLIERLRAALAANSGVGTRSEDSAPPASEPLNTILQAIVQHCTDAGMSFDDLGVLAHLIEKVEQAATPPASDDEHERGRILQAQVEHGVLRNTERDLAYIGSDTPPASGVERLAEALVYVFRGDETEVTLTDREQAAAIIARLANEEGE